MNYKQMYENQKLKSKKTKYLLKQSQETLTVFQTELRIQSVKNDYQHEQIKWLRETLRMATIGPKALKEDELMRSE